MKKNFRLYKRVLKGKDKEKTVYYVQFLKDDGTYTAGRSTGKTKKTEAEKFAATYISEGKISASSFTTIADLAIRKPDPKNPEKMRSHFFDWDGEFTLNKRSRGKKIKPVTCDRYNTLLENHVVRLIGSVRLSEIDTRACTLFRNQLFKEGLAGQTINHCLLTLKAIVDHADDRHLLRHTVRIERASIQNADRGVLSQPQVKKLFENRWSTDDIRGYAASMTAAATGFRLGEIQGIRVMDVEKGRITIRGTWSDSRTEWTPGTKNGQASRSVPIPESVEKLLRELIAINPWGRDEENFVFFSESVKTRPVTDRVLSKQFYQALEKYLEIDEKSRREKNITFHSHRHFFNTLLVESRVPLQKIQALTGHLSDSMTKHYYHLDQMDDVADIQRQMFQIVREA